LHTVKLNAMKPYEVLLPPQHMKPQVGTADYNALERCIDSAKVMAQMTYKVIYLIDYYRENIPYMSKNPIVFAGVKEPVSPEVSLETYTKLIPPDCLRFVGRVTQAGFEFLNHIQPSARREYTLAYNYQIYAPEPNLQILIHHQKTPLLLDAHGNPWVECCMVELAHSSKVHTASMHSASGEYWTFSNYGATWEKSPSLGLTANELSLIRLAYRGHTLDDTARSLGKSIDSIKKYRALLFRKLEVSSMQEAIARALHHKLI